MRLSRRWERAEWEKSIAHATAPETDNSRMVGKNEAACAADAAREVVERWLPYG
jgi:hypothetical protein